MDLSLESLKNRFKNEDIYWYTDNFAISLTSKQSNKEKFQELAVNTFEITLVFIIKISGVLNKIMDKYGWVTTSNLIDIIERRWDKIMIGRFASGKIRKPKRFNSIYLFLETERVNAFSLNWPNEFNLIVPLVYLISKTPVYIISKTIHHFLASPSEARAVLVCPC